MPGRDLSDLVTAPQGKDLSDQLDIRHSGSAYRPPSSATMAGVAGFDSTISNQVRGLGQLALQGGVKAGIVDPNTLAKYQSSVDASRASENQVMAGHPIASTIGSLAAYGGENAALPGSAATMAGRVGLSALQQGVLGGISYTGEGDSRLKNAILGAAGGAVSQGIGEIAGKALNKLGMPLMTKETATTPKALASDPQRTVTETQKILNNISTAQSKYGTGQEVAKATQNFEGKLKSNYQSLYNAADQAAGKDVQLNSESLVPKVNNIVDAYSDKIPDPIKIKLNQFMPFGGKNPLTLGDAKSMAESINARWATTDDPAVKAGLSSLRETIYDEMDSAGMNTPAQKLFQEARQARKAYGDIFGQNDLVHKIIAPKSMADKINNIMQLQPENIVDKVTSGKAPVTNLQQIKNALIKPNAAYSDQDLAQGQAAWQSLKRSAIEQKLFGGNVVQRLPDGTIDPASDFNFKTYSKQYDALGKDVVNLMADDPKTAGQLHLLREAAHSNAQSANSAWTRIRPTIIKILGAGYIMSKANELKNTVIEK